MVTGAASGIGRAIAERLRGDGYDVVGVDLDGADFTADLTTREGNAGAVRAALDRHGRLDVIVANAGMQKVAPVAEFPEDSWDQLLALLLTSPFLLARHGWEALAESGDGRFIAIASAHALAASPNKSAYVAAKHGVLGLVKTLALEGAERGILATAVCPGFVRTPLVEKQIPEQAKALGISEADVIKNVMLKETVDGEFTTVQDVAGLAVFLAAFPTNALTGQSITVSHGWHMQ
jgi:3-hydroxybutyrate dehydrogenase